MREEKRCPIFTTDLCLSLRVLREHGYNERWAKIQFVEAWQVRRGVEPTGVPHPDASKAYAELDPKAKVFVPMMARAITMYLCECGESLIQVMSALGERMRLVGIAFPPAGTGFTNPSDGIPLRDGTMAKLPAAVLDFCAYQHHLAWMVMRELTFEFPEGLAQAPRSEHVVWDPMNPDAAWDPDRLNVLMLCRALDALPADMKLKLLEMAS